LLAGGQSRRQASHAIVIGAGFGGLAAAVRLGARGYRVTVVEKLDEPGGRASQFRQDGFTFDAGPTIITAPFVFEELWALCGRKLSDDVSLVSLDPFYTVRFDDGREFRASMPTTPRWKPKSPNSRPAMSPATGAILPRASAVSRTGFLGMIDKILRHPRRHGPALPGLIMRRAERSVYKLVSKYIKNEQLRQALSFHPLFIGGNPMRSSGVLSLISYLEREYGVHYAIGGTHSLVKGIAGLIAGQGARSAPMRKSPKSPSRRMAAPPGSGLKRAESFRLRSWSPMPMPAGPIRNCLPNTRASAGPTPRSASRQILHEPVRLVFRHRTGNMTTCLTTR
jgi:phytoene desaturase